LPASVINAVMRTGAPLVLHDASESKRFASDPYVVAARPRSVICIPLHRQGRFEGVIYMENNLTAGAFTEDRVEVIKLLAAQASISMENAKLYEDQLRLIQAQQRFVPNQFLESLGHHDIARVSIGEHVAREMSVLFSDLREFTPLSERLGPQATISLLNRYFGHVGAPIADHDGFIAGYAGDEIMALFGGPPDRALQAGIAMRWALEAFNLEQSARSTPVVQMGLGINTGPLVLGTIGTRERLTCSVVGDTVNLASRIEQLTKVYRAPMLIGERTRDALESPDSFSLRKVDRVAVKGKQFAVVIHEVLDAEDPLRRAAKEATRSLLGDAMELYFSRAFAAALPLFERGRAADPQDGVFPLFVARAQRYTANPPPSDWQGFEKLEHK
jgi:class 3 adenylate cyclase